MQPAFRYVVFTLRPLLIAASDTMAVNIDKSVSGMFQTQEVKHVIPVAHGLERIEVPFNKGFSDCETEVRWGQSPPADHRSPQAFSV